MANGLVTLLAQVLTITWIAPGDFRIVWLIMLVFLAKDFYGYTRDILRFYQNESRYRQATRLILELSPQGIEIEAEIRDFPAWRYDRLVKQRTHNSSDLQELDQLSSQCRSLEHRWLEARDQACQLAEIAPAH